MRTLHSLKPVLWEPHRRWAHEIIVRQKTTSAAAAAWHLYDATNGAVSRALAIPPTRPPGSPPA